MIYAIPAPVLRELVDYRERHQAPRPLLRAILANDLFETVGLLQPNPSAFPIADVVRWCFNELPGHARGSRDNVDAWIAAERAQ